MSIEITNETIQKILAVLDRGERVEIIPQKDGIRVVSVKRKQVV